MITSMDFVQSEAVSDTVKPAKYRVFFISEDNEKISNENTYVADTGSSAHKSVFSGCVLPLRTRSTTRTNSIILWSTMRIQVWNSGGIR